MATLKLFDEKHVKEIAKAINRKNEQINKQHKNNGFFEYDNNDDPYDLFLSNSKFKCCSCKKNFTKGQDIIQHYIGVKKNFIHTSPRAGPARRPSSGQTARGRKVLRSTPAARGFARARTPGRRFCSDPRPRSSKALCCPPYSCRS